LVSTTDHCDAVPETAMKIELTAGLGVVRAAYEHTVSVSSLHIQPGSSYPGCPDRGTRPPGTTRQPTPWRVWVDHGEPPDRAPDWVAVAVGHLVDHEAPRSGAVPVLQPAGPPGEVGRPAAGHPESAAADGPVLEEPRLDTRLDPTQQRPRDRDEPVTRPDHLVPPEPGRAVLACRCGAVLDLTDLHRPAYPTVRSPGAAAVIARICCTTCATLATTQHEPGSAP